MDWAADPKFIPLKITIPGHEGEAAIREFKVTIDQLQKDTIHKTMMENLGFDGTLERYSRSVDRWVPLDSDESFSAMKRSIGARRGNRNENARFKVQLKVTPLPIAIPTPEVSSLPTSDAKIKDGDGITANQLREKHE